MKNNLIKLNFIITLLFCLSNAFSQQTKRAFSYNNVVLFDCTGSMAYKDGIVWKEAYTVRNDKDTMALWHPAKIFLKELINEMEDQDYYTIVLYQDGFKEENVLTGQKKDFDPKEFEMKANKLINNSTSTCISGPWDVAIKDYLYKPNNTFNFFYLITDGIENCGHNGHNVVDRIKRFCDNKSGYDHGFYVALTKFAQNEEVKRALETSCIEPIYDPVVEGKIINFAIITPKEIVINSQEFKTKDVFEGIFCSRSKRFPATISYENNDFFDISLSDGVIENGEVKFRIVPKMSMEDIIKAVKAIKANNNKNKLSYSVAVTIQSEDPFMRLYGDTTIIIKINFYVETKVTLPKNPVDTNVVWRSECHPLFMARLCPKWFSSLNPDTIVVPWSNEIEFNEEAQNLAKGRALFNLDLSDCSLTTDEYKVFYGEQELDSTGFEVSTKVSKNLKVIVNNGAKSGQYKLLVKCKDLIDIDRIEGYSNFTDYTYPISFTVNQKKNWGGFVFWSILIVCLLIILRFIWTLIIKPWLIRIRTQNELDAILSNDIGRTKRMSCWINNVQQINAISNEKELSFRHDPNYFVCALYNDNDSNAILDAVFKEFSFDELLKVFSKRKRELMKKEIKKRIASFKSEEMPNGTVALISRRNILSIYEDNKKTREKDYEVDETCTIDLKENIMLEIVIQ